jgi:Zn-dependent M28 family amino/carboxypeptidase
MKTLLPLFVFVIACSSIGFKNDIVPYPSLEQQRTTLANKPWGKPTRILDSTQIITDLIFLASDTCEGRRPGTPGHAAAMQKIVLRMREAGVDSFDNSLISVFNAKPINGTSEGKNVIGWIKGKQYADSFIVVSAHYDHLGKRGANTFYGADDNASGTACLIAFAKYFKQHPHKYSIVFAALDREEVGLEGAYALVQQFNTAKRNIVFNLNMDMIARSDKNEIFASGLSHYPRYKYLVDAVQSKTNVKLLMGHDTGNDINDWTNQSDHAAFHKAKIPFLYIGVEDHQDYHRPSDTWNKVNFSSYLENANLMALMVKAIK